MDLGIAGKQAIVCASSKGLGRGCAEALAAAGVNIVMCARGEEALASAAGGIRNAFGVDVQTAAVDVTTDKGRDALLSLCGNPDILVTNAGGPPPGMWNEWERSDFIAALDANMLTPVDLMKRTLPGMMQRDGAVLSISLRCLCGLRSPCSACPTAREPDSPAMSPAPRGRSPHTVSRSTISCLAFTTLTGRRRLTRARPKQRPGRRRRFGRAGRRAFRPNDTGPPPSLARPALSCVRPMPDILSDRTSCTTAV